MVDCRVYRRPSDRAFWATGKRAGRGIPTWVANCPHCGEEVRWRGSYPTGRATRKNTKDALHHHIKAHHS